MSVSYQPRYKLIVARLDANGKRITSLRQVTSLQSLTCSLTTDTTVGTLTATWVDTDFSTFGATDTRPTPMCIVQLQLTNKQGQWGIAWTGFADSIARVVNMGQNKVYTLSASSPYKLFNVTTQTAAASLGFSMDFAHGVLGTTVLKYAAEQCGYPGPLSLLPQATGWGYSTALNERGQPGTINYNTDAGVDTYGAFSASMYLSPAQQTYSSILQNIVANSELEFFFNEMGQLIWRPLAYLNLPGDQSDAVNQAALAPTLGLVAQRVKIIQKDSIFSHTFTETDQGVLTTIYVRYYVTQTAFNQGVWNAPSAMAQALRPRIMVFYDPWIQDIGSANNLANALGLRYSGNMHTAAVTILADPTITVGTTIRIPKFPDLMPVDNTVNRLPTQLNVQTTPWYYYYVYGITYNLQIGGAWTMDLDLRYGRDEHLQFPYLNDSPYLQDRTVGTGALGNKLTSPQFDANPSNPYQLTTPFSVSIDSTLAPNTIETDKFPPGTVILLKGKNGKVIGTGDYTVVAPPAGANLGNTLVLPSDPANAKGDSYVYVTIDVPGNIAAQNDGTMTNDQGSYTNASGGLADSGTGSQADVQGDHVSQLHDNIANYYCGPACVVRYLRNRTRRGQLGMPISGDKWSQIEQVVAACPGIDSHGSTFSQLQSFIGQYGYNPSSSAGPITTQYTDSWAQVLAWQGEVLLTVDRQPTPHAWPPSFFTAIGSVWHIILWMKDLSPGNLFNDPLAYSPSGVQGDCTYDISSVQAGFRGAVLLP